MKIQDNISSAFDLFAFPMGYLISARSDLPVSTSAQMLFSLCIFLRPCPPAQISSQVIFSAVWKHFHLCALILLQRNHHTVTCPFLAWILLGNASSKTVLSFQSAQIWSFKKLKGGKGGILRLKIFAFAFLDVYVQALS